MGSGAPVMDRRAGWRPTSAEVGADRVASPMVLDLRDAEALDAGVVGGKAAALARALRGGLNPLPGVVLTTAFSDVVDRGAARR